MEVLQVNINQDYLNNLVNQFFKESLNGVTWDINEFLTERFFYFPIKKNNWQYTGSVVLNFIDLFINWFIWS